MQAVLGALTILALLGVVLARAWLMRRRGIRAMHFGELDPSRSRFRQRNQPKKRFPASIVYLVLAFKLQETQMLGR